MDTFELKAKTSKVKGSHSNFPAYADLSNAPTAFWNSVKSGGGDIRVYSNKSLSTELAREVVSCNTTKKTGELHFKCSSIVGGDKFYVTVDGSKSDYSNTATYGRNNVWSNGYLAVWHFQESYSEATGNYKDSTGRGNDGTVGYSNTSRMSSTTGKFGGALRCKTSNATRNTWIDTPSTSDGGKLDDFDVSGWQKSTTNSAAPILTGYTGSTYPWELYPMTAHRFRAYYKHKNSSSSKNISASSVSWPDGNWHLFRWSRTGSDMSLNYDGSRIKSKTDGTTLHGSSKLAINSRHNNAYPSDRTLDEIRLRDVGASDKWAETEYNNQSDPGSFWTWTKVTPATSAKLTLKKGTTNYSEKTIDASAGTELSLARGRTEYQQYALNGHSGVAASLNLGLGQYQYTEYPLATASGSAVMLNLGRGRYEHSESSLDGSAGIHVALQRSSYQNTSYNLLAQSGASAHLTLETAQYEYNGIGLRTSQFVPCTFLTIDNFDIIPALTADSFTIKPE